MQQYKKAFEPMKIHYMALITCMGLIEVSLKCELTSNAPDKNLILEWLELHSDKCPKEVTINSDIQATILGPNQERCGSYKFSTGKKVEVLTFGPNELHVKIGDMTMEIPTSCTDIVSKAEVLYKETQEAGKATNGLTSTNQSTTAQGSVLAVPTLSATPQAPTLRRSGWLGAHLSPLYDNFRVAWNFPISADKSDGGVLITRVVPNSPASRALLRQGDVITSINDDPVNNVPATIKLIQLNPPGTKIRMKVWSLSNNWKEISVTLDESPENINTASSGMTAANSDEVEASLAYSTPELISSAFAKNPQDSAKKLSARLVKVNGRVIRFEKQDPDLFMIGIIMTSQLRPEVIFIDNVKKPYGLIEKPPEKNNTWKIEGSELMLHSEWNEPAPEYDRNPYLYRNYPAGYVPKVIKQENKSVIGIGEDINTRVRFLKANPNAVYFEIVK